MKYELFELSGTPRVRSYKYVLLYGHNGENLYKLGDTIKETYYFEFKKGFLNLEECYTKVLDFNSLDDLKYFYPEEFL